jgi:hypothetical protein
MKPKQTQPPRPLPLLRRAFLSSLDAPQVRARLEAQAFSHPALATMFLLPEGETALRVTGTGLHGDMFLAFRPDGGAQALTVDFRQADKEAAAELLNALGEALQERRLRRPSRRLMGHPVGGYHESVSHFLIWNAGMPMTEEHEILDSAIDAALGLRFRGFDEVGQAMQSLEFDRLARVEGREFFGADGEFPAFLRRGMRADLRGTAAVKVLQDDRRTTLDCRVQTAPDAAGWCLRLHHRWDEDRRRHVIGWVSEDRGGSRRRRAA